MAESNKERAKNEIAQSLTLSTFCMQRIGFSFDRPNTLASYYSQKLMFILSVCGICYHVFSEIVYIGLTLWNSPRVEDVVPLFHTFGYGALSITKVFVLWYKKDVFGQLLCELADIWPMSPVEKDAQNIKNKSLSALRIAHRWYFWLNVSGVWFYNLTPIGVYLFRVWRGQLAEIGFVWVSWYPFNKQQPVAHVAVYIFEMFAVFADAARLSLRDGPRPRNNPIPTHPDEVPPMGSNLVGADTGQIRQTCVWIMISTDLLFSGMASHIGMLLRLLQRRLESLAIVCKIDEEYYQEILSNVKLHQRLIRYCNNLEEAFSLVNLINIVLSSINICCVVFVIVLLEPFVAVSNKLFLGSALIQIGVLCWYADDIYHANAAVASAAYNSCWYKTSPRCRRTLLFLIKRSQKPIAFTAMKFTNISLVTYSAILTRSYSYFALLYTMYRDN